MNGSKLFLPLSTFDYSSKCTNYVIEVTRVTMASLGRVYRRLATMAVRGQPQRAAEQQARAIRHWICWFLVFVSLYTFPSLKSVTSHSSFMHEATETAANRENGAKATIEKASVMVEEEDEPASAADAAAEKPNEEEEEKAKPVEKENSTTTETPATQQSKPQEEKKTEENTPENSEKLEKLNENTEGTQEGSKNETTEAMQIEPEKKDPPSAAAATVETTSEEKKDTASSTAASTEDKVPAAAPPPPPVMKGTLSCDLDARRHLIRGMWNYENSNVFPPQPFELVRKLGDAEDKHKLPQDGTFHGSFRLAYFHTTSKGKQKERVKVIPETNVAIKFTQPDAQTKPSEYQVDGKGTNQFGIFHINGTATRSDMEGDNTLHVVLRKRYESSTTATTSTDATAQTKSNKSDGDDSGPLPEPAKSYPSGVVCLRGKVYKEELSAELGLDEMIQRISGMWSSGLDFILADPDNVRGLCNRFEYEHKSSQSGQGFPVSGRYSGWFDLSNEDGSRTRINERDVTLKFRKNREGFYNVEGKGSNVFGKYSITGTVTADNIITIFRHFQPRKLKTKATNNAEDGKTTTAPRRPSISAAQATLEAKLKLADVVLSADGAKVDPITPPITGTYSAVSRGVLRVNGDGSHSCQGKWAVTREHFTNGQTSNFNFRLEAHFAADASTRETRKFPLNSPMYKGSFQLKKGGSRYQTIVDQQVVMKFAENNQGSFNVHGKGLNAIGEFNLIGTMVMSGKTGGQVELYRMYPPEKLAAPAPAATEANGTVAKSSVASGLTASGVSSRPAIPVPPQGIQRRESTRMVKLPSRLEDDDPSAQLARIMDKCAQILRIIRERDVELGAFFSEPVDPVALGIPTYFQIIKHPMDLRTVHRKMESQQIVTPEEFARHVRLVFENAMTFNIDPTHSVHQAARSLLVLFNQKFRDVDRMVQNVRRTHGTDWDEKGRIKKSDKKRKRGQEETKSLKRLRLEEAEAMAAANASAVASLVAAAPATNAANVSRSEFNMLLHLIQQLQKQVVQTHTALADLCPGDENDAKIAASGASSALSSVPSTMAPEPPKKKATKRRTPVPLMEVVEEAQPLNLAEQELLTETINDLPPEHLGGVIQIIREAAPVGADEDEIDLEIDQLDAKTQRKLLSHVSKFMKKSRGKGKKKAASKSAAPPAKKARTTKAPAPAPAPKQQKQPIADPFFAFGKGDSESDDSSDENDNSESNGKNCASTEAAPAASNDNSGFQLTTEDNHEDDDNDDLVDGSLATANWNLNPTTPVKDAVKASAKDDDEWRAAGEQAEAAKAREEERKAREEKMKAETEKARLKEQEEAVAQAKEKQKEKVAEEARLKEQKEKEAEEARKAARAALQGEVEAVAPTVDLGDAQRDIMKQYEQSFLDKDYGSASPSSDFGF